MSNNPQRLIYFILGLLAGMSVVTPWKCRHGQAQDLQDATETKVVTVYDTVTYRRPVAVDSVVVRFETVRLPLAECDEQADGLSADSATVELPITQSVWTDSTYTAYISGYRARLDSIYICRPTIERTVTRQAKPRHWGLSAGAGVSVTPSGRIEPAVFVGVTYTFKSL